MNSDAYSGSPASLQRPRPSLTTTLQSVPAADSSIPATHYNEQVIRPLYQLLLSFSTVSQTPKLSFFSMAFCKQSHQDMLILSLQCLSHTYFLISLSHFKSSSTTTRVAYCPSCYSSFPPGFRRLPESSSQHRITLLSLP